MVRRVPAASIPDTRKLDLVMFLHTCRIESRLLTSSPIRSMSFRWPKLRPSRSLEGSFRILIKRTALIGKLGELLLSTPCQNLVRNDSMTFAPEHHYAKVGDSLVHFVTAGEGPALVLLHGWPQTWYAWRKVMPELSKSYRVIAPDLRGLGDSSRPSSGFDMRTVAGEIANLLQGHLGLKKIHLAGHDWGGPAAFALAAFHPGLVQKLVMWDAAVPGDGSGSYSQAGRRWHHAFHQTLDLPEALIAGREDVYYRWFYRQFGHRPDAMSESDIQEYLRTYRDVATLRTGLSYYRNVPQDVRDNEEFLRNGRLTMPILAYGGAESMGRGEEGFTSLQRVGQDVKGGTIPDCGHWVAEERPEFVIAEMSAFLRG